MFLHLIWKILNKFWLILKIISIDESKLQTSRLNFYHNRSPCSYPRTSGIKCKSFTTSGTRTRPEDTDTLWGQGHAQRTRTRSEDTDTLRGHGHAQRTRTRSEDTDTLKGHGHAQRTRTRSKDTARSRSRHGHGHGTVTARHGHDTVEIRKSCKLGICTVSNIKKGFYFFIIFFSKYKKILFGCNIFKHSLLHTNDCLILRNNWK